MFQQEENFDPIYIIHKFYKSPELKALVEKMMVVADKITRGENVQVPDSLVQEMNQVIPIVPFLTAGNRPELFGNLRRGQFETAMPDKANPNKPLHLDPNLKDKPEIRNNIVDGQYVNPNPSNEKDPLDPNPPQDHPAWKHGWLQGWTMKVGNGISLYFNAIYV